MFWKLVPPILSAIALLVAAILDYLHHDKRTKKFKRGRATLFMLIALFLLVSPAAVYRDEHNRLEEQQKLAEELATLRAQSKTQLNTITGGDSYCNVGLGVGNDSTGAVDAFLFSQGPYPLYDVKIFVLTWQKDIPSVPVMNIGNLAPEEFRPLGKWPFPKTGNRVDYEIIIRARNGVNVQLISFRRVNGNWLLAEKLYNQHNGYVYFEHVAKEFPIKEFGEPDYYPPLAEPRPYLQVVPHRTGLGRKDKVDAGDK